MQSVAGSGCSVRAHSSQDYPRGEATCTGSQFPSGRARIQAQASSSQNHIPSLQFPSKGGSQHHHFVFCQGGCLAACQSLASGSQVLTKHRPEQEGGVEGLCQASRLYAPSPASPPPAMSSERLAQQLLTIQNFCPLSWDTSG